MQAMIVSALKLAGFTVKRSLAQRSGDPDLWAEREGVRLAIEVKRDDKAKVGLWQLRRLQQLRNEGYVAEVVFGYADFERKFGRYL